MKLIHKNPECRDIAIWFDEFLTPGESFKENIDRILQSCEMFTLLVTPNLLEKPDGKPNFVMAEEYPAARDSGKEVLPAEMEQTDRFTLSAAFKELPECVDARNDKEFRDRLLESLKRVAISENNSDPEHNYLIGLAYLEGIDVELNYERAQELIVSAAEDGFKPAFETLVSMYRTGHGVAKNYGEAAVWQLRLAELCYDRYNENPTVETISDVIVAYMNLGDLYKEVNFIDEATEAYQTMLNAAQSLYEQTNTRGAKEDIATALNRIALIKKETEDYKEFNRLLSEVVEIDGEIYDDANWIQATHLSNLGLSQYYLQDYHCARMNLEKAIELMDSIDCDNALMVLKARMLNNLGKVLQANLQHEDALRLYEKAIDIVESINRYTDNLYILDYGLFVSNIVYAYIFLGEFSKATEFLKPAYKMLKSAIRENTQLNLAGTIALLQNLIARLYSEQKEYDQAEKYYNKSLKWYAIFDDMGMKLYCSEIALVYHNLGSMLLSKGDNEGAENNLIIAYGRFSKLAEEETTFKRMMALSGFNLAVSQINQRKYRDAFEYIMVSFDFYKELLGNECSDQDKDMYKKSAEQIFYIYLKTGHPIKGTKFLYSALKEIE